MPAEQLPPLTPQMQCAVEELQGLIRRIDPTATFQVVSGDDPAGTYVMATVDVEDTETVVDGYIDRLLALQIDDGLPVYVIPVRSPARVARALAPEEGRAPSPQPQGA